jgi:hypothetical protein
VFQNAFAITPSDTTEINVRGIYVGGAGNLAVQMEGGGEVTLTAVLVGHVYKIAARKVKATGTTATALIGLK